MTRQSSIDGTFIPITVVDPVTRGTLDVSGETHEISVDGGTTWWPASYAPGGLTFTRGPGHVPLPLGVVTLVARIGGRVVDVPGGFYVEP